MANDWLVVPGQSLPCFVGIALPTEESGGLGVPAEAMMAAGTDEFVLGVPQES